MIKFAFIMPDDFGKFMKHWSPPLDDILREMNRIRNSPFIPEKIKAVILDFLNEEALRIEARNGNVFVYIALKSREVVRMQDWLNFPKYITRKGGD